mgnify:CR=1 FL=1
MKFINPYDEEAYNLYQEIWFQADAFERINALIDKPNLTDNEKKVLKHIIAMNASEYAWLSNSLDRLSDDLYEIVKSWPHELQADEKKGRIQDLKSYFRWALWEDCMADVPYQLERALQSIVGAAFDSARGS